MIIRFKLSVSRKCQRKVAVADYHQAQISAAAFLVTVHTSRKLLCW